MWLRKRFGKVRCQERRYLRICECGMKYVSRKSFSDHRNKNNHKRMKQIQEINPADIFTFREMKDAHKAVRLAISRKEIDRPTKLKCVFCPAYAEEYDHYKGYSKINQLTIRPVCRACHLKHKYDNRIIKEV